MLLCDLNCDTGEGCNNEAQLLPFLSSANIACGMHAGDDDTMKRVIEICLENNVSVGAHPSYPDRKNFGRTEMIGRGLVAKDVFPIVQQQVAHLAAIATACGVQLHHVKPHGALYNRAAWDDEVGYFLCKAVHNMYPAMPLYGLSGSNLEGIARSFGLPFVHEVFADRTYRADGTLTPRTAPNALIEEIELAAAQVKRMVYGREVLATTGERIRIEAGTVCIHGDAPGAVALAERLHAELQEVQPEKNRP